MNQESLKKTLFLDVQTSSACKNYESLSSEWKALWDEQIFKDEDVSNLSPSERYLSKAALRAEFAVVAVASIGAITFSSDTNEPILHVKAFRGKETDILASLTSTFEKFDQIVGHGIKSFDIPFLGRRYLANGLNVPKLIDVRGAKPWEIVHQDTQELWRFGDLCWPSLNVLCQTLSYSYKQEIKASDVPALYWSDNKDGSNKLITEFSLVEVMKTANVFIKLQEPGLSINNYNIL